MLTLALLAARLIIFFKGQGAYPYVEKYVERWTKKGSTVDPVLTAVTCGKKEKSRIFHTQEGNYHQKYRTKSVSKNCIIAMCIHSLKTGVKCKAETRFRPKKSGLIVEKRKKDENERQTRYRINFDIDPNGEDWESWFSGKHGHSQFCLLPKHKRSKQQPPE